MKLSAKQEAQFMALLSTPLLRAALAIKFSAPNMEYIANIVKGEFRVLDEQAQGQNSSNLTEADALARAKEFEKKIDVSCGMIFNAAVRACKKVMKALYPKCKKKLKFFRFLCLPLKATFLCEAIRMVKFLCKSPPQKSGNFSEDMAETAMMVDNLDKEFKADVDVQYPTVVNPFESISMPDIDPKFMREIRHEIARIKRIMSMLILICQAMTTYIVIFLVWGSIKYTSRYVIDIEYDNVYLTKYFYEIDKRRKAASKPSILPLKKMESKNYVPCSKIYLSKAEIKALKSQIVMFLIKGVIFSFIYLFDNSIVKTTLIVQRNLYVEFDLRGTNRLTVEVGGVGFMASVVRVMMSAMEYEGGLHISGSNIQCLPNPSIVSPADISMMISLVVGDFLLCFVAAISKRSRRMICSFFYRKREKQRIIHLYNSLLKSRILFVGQMRARVEELVRDHNLAAYMDKNDPLMRFVNKIPQLGMLMRKIGLGKRRCLFCSEKEKKKTFFRCDTTYNCPYIYCHQCRVEAGDFCMACEIQTQVKRPLKPITEKKDKLQMSKIILQEKAKLHTEKAKLHTLADDDERPKKIHLPIELPFKGANPFSRFVNMIVAQILGIRNKIRDQILEIVYNITSFPKRLLLKIQLLIVQCLSPIPFVGERVIKKLGLSGVNKAGAVVIERTDSDIESDSKPLLDHATPHMRSY